MNSRMEDGPGYKTRSADERTGKLFETKQICL